MDFFHDISGKNIEFNNTIFYGEFLMEKVLFLLNVTFFAKKGIYLYNPKLMKAFQDGPICSANSHNGIKDFFKYDQNNSIENFRNKINNINFKNVISEDDKVLIIKGFEKIINSYDAHELYNLCHSDEIWYTTFLKAGKNDQKQNIMYPDNKQDSDIYDKQYRESWSDLADFIYR